MPPGAPWATNSPASGSGRHTGRQPLRRPRQTPGLPDVDDQGSRAGRPIAPPSRPSPARGRHKASGSLCSFRKTENSRRDRARSARKERHREGPDPAVSVSPVLTKESVVRIAFLNWRDSTTPGGGAESTRRPCAGLAARGHDVSMFCARHPGSAAEEMRASYRFLRQGGRLGVYAATLRRLRAVEAAEGAFDAVIDTQNGLPFAAPLATRSPWSCWCTTSTASSGPLSSGASRPRSAGPLSRGSHHGSTAVISTSWCHRRRGPSWPNWGRPRRCRRHSQRNGRASVRDCRSVGVAPPGRVGTPGATQNRLSTRSGSWPGCSHATPTSDCTSLVMDGGRTKFVPRLSVWGCPTEWTCSDMSTRR